LDEEMPSLVELGVQCDIRSDVITEQLGWGKWEFYRNPERGGEGL